MSIHSKLWTAAVATCMAILILAALVLKISFHLTEISDWMQCVLLLSGALSFLPNALRSRGRTRIFWALLASGMALWFFYQVMWMYFELWMRQEVPDIFAGDIVLFLHIVPMMAALALRPHAPQDEYSGSLRSLDFTLLICWWVYLYVFAVMAWQYVEPNPLAYGNNLNSIYLIEKIAFLAALLASWYRSPPRGEGGGGWKLFYANLFGASLTYAASSYLANWALSRDVYYSGSLYDIPLAASMLWITLTGLSASDCQPEIARSGSASHGVWLARLGMVTVFSLPIFAGWAWLGSDPSVRSFRLILTLCAALSLGILVFFRQSILDRELRRLLDQSRESFVNLKRLQAQITESEKMASIGQLVGGAAHELNNPITAMLGYSDLLLSTRLTPEQHVLATRLGHQVRRTMSLVASLLSFAKHSPTARTPVNLATLLRTAVRISQSQGKSLNIQMETHLQPEMPPVIGDSNQLLQVCVQLLNSAMNAVESQPGRTLSIACAHQSGIAVIHVVDAGPVSDELAGQPGTGGDSIFAASPLSGLGLSACQGIIQQHRGNIFAQHSPPKGFIIRVELPLHSAPPLSAETAVPGTWQPQPSA